MRRKNEGSFLGSQASRECIYLSWRVRAVSTGVWVWEVERWLTRSQLEVNSQASPLREWGPHTRQSERWGSQGPWPSHTHTQLSHPQIWYLLEGSYQVYKLFPSKGWEVHVSLQVMQQSSLYAPNETMVTLFYEDHRLYQVLSGGLWGRHGEAAGPLMWPCLLAAAGVPYRQPAGQARQEACACGAASDVPADQHRLPLGAAGVRRYWTTAAVRALGAACGKLPFGGWGWGGDQAIPSDNRWAERRGLTQPGDRVHQGGLRGGRGA